ncbi:ABC transporter ATP-binding protein [Tabrizicola sp.]|uniref:ABC transporter ATP-binding protein n=1 Tax=Tabrizicola sp. TaxID=2005166 RepID=UPI003F31A73B
MTLLALENLSKRYGALVVTEDLSLEVEPGEILGILGPNGAGKTTLFNLIAGTVQPNAGHVLFRGQDITGLDVSARCRQGISRSFQIPHPFSGMTVFENVLVGATFGRHAHAVGPEARAATVLELTGLKPKANSLAGSLTLLERKRLELARALATDPELLLLDEIAGGLTERECQSLLSAVRDVHASGVTIVWIEHVVHALLSVAKRLVVVNFGRKIADDTPEAVLASPEVKSVYMGADHV